MAAHSASSRPPPSHPIRLRALSDSALHTKAAGLDPNFSPNPTIPLEKLDLRKLQRLQHECNNVDLKVLQTPGTTKKDYPCPFCDPFVRTLWTSDDNTLMIVLPYKKRIGALIHLLCVPVTQEGRKHITTVDELNKSHVSLLRQMKRFSIKVLGEVLKQNKMSLDSDFLLNFHVPPFNSVDHLHLHITVYDPRGPRLQVASALHNLTRRPLSPKIGTYITSAREISQLTTDPKEHVSVVVEGAPEGDKQHLLISVDQLIEILEDGNRVQCALRARDVTVGRGAGQERKLVEVKEYEVVVVALQTI